MTISRLAHKIQEPGSPLARRYRKLVKTLAAYLGGEKPDPAEKAIIEQAALITMACDDMKVAYLNGDKVSTNDIVRLTNAATRLLEVIGIEKQKRKALHRQDGVAYYAFVDTSGGSADDSCLAIAHAEADIIVLDLVVKQNGPAPFNPRNAVGKFCTILREWGITSVTGDNYAGLTFSSDFEERDIRYIKSQLDKTDIYESFEPGLMPAKSACSTSRN
jgi:hypothetical protein